MSQLDAATLAALLSTFLEESFEGLDRAEAGLLRLSAAPDPEVIGDLFRAIHSIKGGAGAFDVAEVTDLAHIMENLLDDLRSGAVVTDEVCAALLAGVDELRATLRERQDGRRVAPGTHDAVCARLIASRTARPTTGAAAPAAQPAAPQAAGPAAWIISFVPDADMMASGNDPLRIVRELVELGAEVSSDTSRLPALDRLEPTELYLGWRIRMPGHVSRAQLDEVFAWVEGDCTLAIDREATTAAPSALAGGPSTAGVPAPGVHAGPTDPAASPGGGGTGSGATAEPASSASDARRPAPPAAPRSDDGNAAHSGIASVRVGMDKIDLLMNMVGELVITQSMLGEIDGDGPLSGARVAQIREGLLLLARNTRALQESVVRLRSMPIGMVFARLPRLVHDISAKLGKQIELATTGQGTELDKTVLEKLGDPLVHIVRNSIDHGIELPADRVAAGKPALGTIHIHAEHRGSAIIIEISDDGRGLDYGRILAIARQRGLVAADAQLRDDEIAKLIFAPGFSTATAVSDISGRGVGMDVVYRHLKEVGGDVHVESTPGRGTRTRLRVPLTLAIIDGQLVRVAEHCYVMPLLSIIQTVELDPTRLKRLGTAELYRVRDDIVPVVDLGVAFGLRSRGESTSQLLMIVEADGAPLGLIVDELLAQQQIVIKSLETNFGRIDGLSGATILGDGEVAFIVDIVALGRSVRGGIRSLAA